MARFNSLEDARNAGLTDAHLLSLVNRYFEQKAYRKNRQLQQRELIRRAKELGLDRPAAAEPDIDVE